MPYEQRDMSGSLFTNKKKEKENHPNTQGSCMIDGVEYWISGWTKTSQSGEKWVSLAFKRKDDTQERAASTPPLKSALLADDDSIPF